MAYAALSEISNKTTGSEGSFSVVAKVEIEWGLVAIAQNQKKRQPKGPFFTLFTRNIRSTQVTNQ
jgi:hypothetical protein